MKILRLLLLILILSFFLHASAFADAEDNFYLQTRIAPQKLIPSTLQLTLHVGETSELEVDPIPSDADVTKLVWELTSSDIAEVSGSGRVCQVRAKSIGTGTINISDPDGATISVKLSVEESATKSLSLDVPDNSILAGESVLIHANSIPQDAEIRWSVHGEDFASFSYGGSLCRVKGNSPGQVTVRASIAGTDLAQEVTIHIEGKPVNRIYILNMLLRILIVGAILLLAFALIQRLRFRKGH